MILITEHNACPNKTPTLSAPPYLWTNVSMTGEQSLTASCAEENGTFPWLTVHVTPLVSSGSQARGEIGPERPFLQLSGKDLSRGI